jgi:hypothetical protein
MSIAENSANRTPNIAASSGLDATKSRERVLPQLRSPVGRCTQKIKDRNGPDSSVNGINECEHQDRATPEKKISHNE